MKKIAIYALCAVCMACPALAREHAAHEHGAAKINVAVEDAEVTIELDSPFDNFLGFEHAPQTKAQKSAVSAMVKSFENAEKLFVMNTEAQCSFREVEIENNGIPQDEESGHGDLEASFSFVCAKPEKLNGFDVRLFPLYPTLKEIEVRLATPKEQKAFELTPDNTVIKW